MIIPSVCCSFFTNINKSDSYFDIKNKFCHHIICAAIFTPAKRKLKKEKISAHGANRTMTGRVNFFLFMLTSEYK